MVIFSRRLSEVFSIVGLITSFFSLFLFFPALIGYLYSEPIWTDFIILGILFFAFGIIIFTLFKKTKSYPQSSSELQAKDGLTLVLLVWILLSTISSTPFLMFDENMSFIRAFFEAVSGLTTTGATIFSGLELMPKAILIWRAILQWLGGMGILVLTIAILPMFGVGGMQIFRAEASGPMKDKKFTPRIAETAKALWTIYVFLTLFCCVGYWVAGMELFDALAHAFTTVSIGGLSTYDESIGFFNSFKIEAVAVFFMLLAAMNFTLHFAVLRSFSLKAYLQSIEARYFFSIIFISVAFIFLVLLINFSDESSLSTIARITVFNVVSIATTTGYATTDYNLWPTITFSLMLLLSCFTTCSGSTGGGVKLIRAIIMLKQARREILRTVHPHAIIPIKIGNQTVANRVILAVLAFMFFYLLTLVTAFLLLTSTGLSAGASISAALACLNNLGPALFELGPSANYGILSDIQLSILSVVMLLGRLELLTIFVFFSVSFWKS